MAPDQPGAVQSAVRDKKPGFPWEAAEKQLNCFVGAVALMERLGNGLGTLAFTWATVVVLGGFSTNLGQDFWYATAIVFLEALRVFSRESRSDDELLFKTTGSIRLKRVKLTRGIPYYLTVGIVMVCLYGTLEFTLRHYGYLPRPPLQLQYHCLLLTALLALASMAKVPTIAAYVKDHAFLQSSALVAVLALGGAMLWSHTPKRQAVLVIPPLFVGCLQYSAVKAIRALVSKEQQAIKVCLQKLNIHVSSPPPWLRTLGALILPAWIVVSVLVEFGAMGILILLGTLLLGNIQIPVALARIVLSSMRLATSNDNHHDTSNEHLAPALTIFYSMVLGQGALYLAACILETLFSYRVRTSLAKSCGLAYTKGYDSINLYYEHAYNKRMEEGVLAQEDLILVSFSFNSLNSNSSDKKLASVRILHSLLLHLQGASNTGLVSKITISTKVVASLIGTLGWTAPEDQGISIRLYAAKVVAVLAVDLRIVGIPGTIQMVSSLLDDVDAKNQFVKEDSPDQTEDINEEINNSMLPGLQEGKESHNDEDLFPVLGMLILESLARNLDNCAEISRAVGLIPKVIGFMSYATDTTNTSKAQQKLIMTSSLKLVAKLASTEGETGTVLRQKISGQPLLLSNLAEILEDSSGRSEQWKPTMVILSKLAVDEEISQEIGSFQVIIPKLVHAFLGTDEHSLQMVAAEALSNLSMENTSNCLAILEETGYELIWRLKNMLLNDEYTYIAASLLQNLCAHSRDKLRHQGSSEHLSFALQVVLEKIMHAKGKQLEALIGLASQIYNVIPEHCIHVLDSQTNVTGLVQKLVRALNSNKKPSSEYPRMRRVIVEMAIFIVESCPRYATIFREQGMMEALSKVERTPTRLEKYRIFFGDVGVVAESGLPLHDLVARAKGLIGFATPSPEAFNQVTVNDSSSLALCISIDY
ncbi:uncharacterized protein LOC133886990 [Phragmites australis]|uniref:uncharacterized protein LOC133886990 n=1 Tax=Phragmites australis TaxID=29695 RepID=UPI002D77CB51|nr:uncharacterized protein LOC133886990 [Phragmites australis]